MAHHSERPETPATTTHESARERVTIPRPDEEQVVYRVDDRDAGTALHHDKKFDLPATLGGALAALGTLLLLSSIVAAIVGSIGYQSDVKDKDLSIGGLVAGLVVLFLACLVGGWVAGRIARRRGALHGLVAILWLVLLAGALAALAAIFGDDFDITGDIGLPTWFSEDAFTTGAIISGLVALALALLGGWLGGKLGGRRHEHESVALVETRHAVREHPGGILNERTDTRVNPSATQSTTQSTTQRTTR